MINLAATASYLPETWMTAAEIADASGIPESVIAWLFGIREVSRVLARLTRLGRRQTN